jgi:hypothetical protein
MCSSNSQVAVPASRFSEHAVQRTLHASTNYAPLRVRFTTV